MGDDFREDAQPDVALSFEIGFVQGLATEGVTEEVAFGEEGPEPAAATDRAEGSAKPFDSFSLSSG